MNGFTSEPEALVRAQLEACERVLRSGWWVLGQEVAEFERQWAGIAGVPHVVGCGNGLDAIDIGLRAMGIGAGDEVITTPMTAFATVLAVLRAGATPVLADIDPLTAMLDPASVSRCLGPRTRAILLVHLYGQIGPVDELGRLATDAGIHLLEDCAQAHGARLRGHAAGSHGAFAAWSFYPTKNLGAVGDGGALSTASPEIAANARSLRNYGQTVRYQHPVLGMNSRLDELQAAILQERLRYLPQWIGRRREVATAYTAGIRNPHIRIATPPDDAERHAHHLFVVTCDARESLQAHLQSKGVDTLIHYPIPVHQQEPCRHLRRDPQGLGEAERHAATCLSLPCHPGLTDADMATVIAAANSFET